jgi:hypothetical protein
MKQVLHLIVCLMSWNAGSLYTGGSLYSSSQGITRYALDLVGVQEVRGGRDIEVGIVTSYGLDGPGIESRWG